MDVSTPPSLDLACPQAEAEIEKYVHMFRDRGVDKIKYGHYKKNTLLWWYMFVTVGRVFCHACTSMTNLWQNQDSHTCAIVEVFHDITKIIITEVSTSMTINRAS